MIDHEWKAVTGIAGIGGGRWGIMAQAEILKNLVKPPFANYDIVVYFGCGLFSLPFIKHYYIEPFGLRFPKFDFPVGIPFAGEFIATLALLFTVYIIGHVAAYAGSQIIEKAVGAFFGKTSTVLLVSEVADEENWDSRMRAHLKKRWRKAFQSTRFANGARALAHFPVWLHYLVIYHLGIFGFYESRVPPAVMAAARTRLAELRLPDSRIVDGVPWFKSIEGYVINNHPIATARMYNYLVISGLFRSISLIFLIALWAELVFLIGELVSGRSIVGHFMSDGHGALRSLWSYFMLSMVYLFAAFSFLKFQRRYVEEAIFAFVLTKD